jgi:signal peptidase II
LPRRYIAKIMRVLRKILLVSISILCLVGCDYTSKNVAKKELKDSTSHSYMYGNIQFVYAENSGGMLSLGSNLSEKTKLVIFKYSVSLMLLLLFVYTIATRRISKKTIIAFIFILSGGIGNLIDRFTNDGKVVDFIVMSIFNYHTGIFNLADMYVTIGVSLIIISTLLNKYYKPENAI